MKTQHKEIPPNHRFPDYSWIQYWRSKKDGLVYGQLYSSKGKRVLAPFTYHGDTP